MITSSESSDVHANPTCIFRIHVLVDCRLRIHGLFFSEFTVVTSNHGLLSTSARIELKASVRTRLPGMTNSFPIQRDSADRLHSIAIRKHPCRIFAHSASLTIKIVENSNKCPLNHRSLSNTSGMIVSPFWSSASKFGAAVPPPIPTAAATTRERPDINVTCPWIYINICSTAIQLSLPLPCDCRLRTHIHPAGFITPSCKLSNSTR